MTYVTYSHDINKGDGKFTPFYVGKGSYERANLVGRRNYHYANVVNKYGKSNVRVTVWSEVIDEMTAFALEIELIAFLRSEGIKLTNATSGGEGPSGLIHTEKTKRKMREAQLVLNNLPERKARFTEQMRGNSYAKGYRHTHETKQILAEKSAGKLHTEESKRKIGAKQLGEKNHRFGKPPHNKGVPMTEEAKERLSIVNKGNFCITDGKENKVFPEGSDVSHFLSNGWKFGMTKKKVANWLNKDGKLIRVSEDQLEFYLSEGWKRGRK